MANRVAPARVVTSALAWRCSMWCPTVLGEIPQGGRHLLVGVAAGDQSQDVDLPLGEARRPGHVRRAGRLPGCGEHGFDLGSS
jgi:hypothetical protein